MSSTGHGHIDEALAGGFSRDTKPFAVWDSAPGVGKSFVTLILAAVLAQAGQRVLVIDGDIRRGYLHTALGVSNDYGLSDFLASVDKSPAGGPIDKNNLSTVIHKTKVPNRHFISRGTAAPNPSELLMHPRMEKCLVK